MTNQFQSMSQNLACIVRYYFLTHVTFCESKFCILNHFKTFPLIPRKFLIHPCKNSTAFVSSKGKIRARPELHGRINSSKENFRPAENRCAQMYALSVVVVVILDVVVPKIWFLQSLENWALREKGIFFAFELTDDEGGLIFIS